jgi:orotate phosphoribosyltransferase
MDARDVLQLFKLYDAYLEGHFILTSGLHSPHYFQCARVLQHPSAAARLGEALGKKIEPLLGGARPDAVLSPAMGGLIIGHELGRHFDCRAIFVERQAGEMKLRRFEIDPGEKVVVVEDVVTTGGSLFEAVRVAEAAGAEVLAVSCLVDRTSPEIRLARPLVSLARVDARTFQPADCPLCKQGLPLVKPGSRGLDKGTPNG